jgi:hypothetical protein
MFLMRDSASGRRWKKMISGMEESDGWEGERRRRRHRLFRSLFFLLLLLLLVHHSPTLAVHAP